MASNTIEGRAKKHDGTAIDYVSIFNWIDGTCIAQVKPDASGAWSYPYTEDVKVGITYVANGCEPITHGAYDFLMAVDDTVLSGFLMALFRSYTWGDSADQSMPQYDKDNTSHPDWEKNFSKVLDIGLFDYRAGLSSGNVPKQSKVIEGFDLSWQLEIYFKPAIGNNNLLTLELMNDAGGVLFAIKVSPAAYDTQLEYGNNLNNLQKFNKPASATTSGLLKFTESSVSFTNYIGDGSASFNHAFDLTDATKVRVGGQVSQHFNNQPSNSTAYILLLPKTIT